MPHDERPAALSKTAAAPETLRAPRAGDLSVPALVEFYERELLEVVQVNRFLQSELEKLLQRDGACATSESVASPDLSDRVRQLESSNRDLARQNSELSERLERPSSAVPGPPPLPFSESSVLRRVADDRVAVLNRLLDSKNSEVSELTRRLNELQENVSAELDKHRQSLEDQHQSELNALQNALENDVNQIAQLYIQERDKRREYYDKLVEIRGNLRVLCRCRSASSPSGDASKPSSEPPSDSESDPDSILSFPIPGEVVLLKDNKELSFEYDIVYNGGSHDSLFHEVQQYIQSVLDGHNLSVFVYGGAKSGKSYTLLGGSSGEFGLIRLSIPYLFDLAFERNEVIYTFIISAVNFYRDTYSDLLTPPHNYKMSDVRDTESGVFLDGVSEVLVSSPEDVEFTLKKIRDVQEKYGQAHYPFNHTIISLVIKSRSALNDEMTVSKLHFIELASNAEYSSSLSSDRRADILCVNKTFSSLSEIVSQLSHKSKYIPYRHAKLTSFLQDSLTLSSKIVFISCISPLKTDLDQTQRTLESCSKFRKVDLEIDRSPVELSLDRVASERLHSEVVAREHFESRRIPFVSTYQEFIVPVPPRSPRSFDAPVDRLERAAPRSERQERQIQLKGRQKPRLPVFASSSRPLAPSVPVPMSVPSVASSSRLSDNQKLVSRPKRPVRSAFKGTVSKSQNSARKPAAASAVLEIAGPSTAPVSKSVSFLKKGLSSRPRAD